MNCSESIANSKFVQNLMIDVPNFAENASFQSLLKLSQTSKEMRERLLPRLKAMRVQELIFLQNWLPTWGSTTLNKNYTLEELSHLEVLDLSYNQITKIPPAIRQLINLKVLYLPGNNISEIGQLTQQHGCNLKVLSLWGNQITEIPPEIGLLKHLEKLWLYDNQITKIPPEIRQLINLRELDLSRNHITEIPPEIGQLINLNALYLAGNLITVIPSEIGQLTNLNVIDISFNQISKFPPNLKRPSNFFKSSFSA